MNKDWQMGFSLGLLVVYLQVLAWSVSGQACTRGFETELYLFEISTFDLPAGRRLGKVVFNDCTGLTQTVFKSADKQFEVETDGTLRLVTHMTLDAGYKKFSVHAWDPQGQEYTVDVLLELNKSSHHEKQFQLQEQPHQVDLLQPVIPEPISTLPVLLFPKSSMGLRRRKREWVMPPISIPENSKGPFPQNIGQIRTEFHDEILITYSLSGAGADQPPKEVFKIESTSGLLSLTQPLDREKQANYLLLVHAAAGGKEIETPMELQIVVIDQNDNKPIFANNTFIGNVAEASKIGTEFMVIIATDADDPTTLNADIRYEILSQNPPLPNKEMFSINPVTGKLLVNSTGLDKETISKYTLEIQAADTAGAGLSARCRAIITITDSNDQAPQFVQSQYEVSVPENKVGEVVAKIPVTDGDDPNTPAWAAKFNIISGNTGDVFSIETGPSKQEAIIKTTKPLDFEAVSKYTLVVTVVNEIDFATPLPTSTAQVVVNVLDVNEAPIFKPPEKKVSKREDISVGTNLLSYIATDPDTAKKQKLTYKVGRDPGGWLDIEKETGLVKVKSPMDRESNFVKKGMYSALILAVDDDLIPATGTGTLLIELEDVNDSPPVIVEKNAKLCNEEPGPLHLTVTDQDEAINGAPYRVEMKGETANDWTAYMNETKTGVVLKLKSMLPQETYSVILKLYDNHGLSQISTVDVTVCKCKGVDFHCNAPREPETKSPVYLVIGTLAGILLLLVLLMLLLVFIRRKTKENKEPTLVVPICEDIFYYNDQGGGEDDQDFDLRELHRGLDNRPEVFRNDVVPTYMPAPHYRPRPSNPEEIGNFIDDNLKAAHEDPSAPPYDSLLVFDHEGAASQAGTLSSLYSSCSGNDLDYDCLEEWGPRFKKLADMFGGEED